MPDIRWRVASIIKKGKPDEERGKKEIQEEEIRREGKAAATMSLDITAQVPPSRGSVGSALNDLGLAGKDARCIGGKSDNH